MTTRSATALPAGVLALVVPAGLLGLAALAVTLPLFSRDQLESFLAVYRWVPLALGALLGARFRRGRVVFALVALAIADRTLAHLATVSGRPEAARFGLAATAVLLPLDLAWLALARERGTLTASGFRRLALLASQPAIAAFLWLSYHPALVSRIGRPFLPALLAPFPRLPHSATAAFALALAVTGWAWFRRRSSLESGFLWAVVGSLAALASDAPATAMYLATAGLVLVIALVESAFAMAYRDPLTGLPGRRAFDEALAKLSGRFAIAMVDVDHFKEVNDRYGHDVGDQVLRMLAARAGELAGARAFRFGGEEFAVVFPGATRSEAVERLDGWRAAIADLDFALRGRNRPRRKPAGGAPQRGATATLPITVSAGVAEAGGRLLEPRDVVRAADEALYRAKRGGRNRVST